MLQKRLFLMAGLLLCLSVLVVAQQSGTAATKSDKNSMTITGCVQKGHEPGGYYLTDESGKTWELSGTKVADHTGHKVTLTGMATQAGKSEEARNSSSEKAEAAGNPRGDFHVASVKMISESCQ